MERSPSDRLTLERRPFDRFTLFLLASLAAALAACGGSPPRAAEGSPPAHPERPTEARCREVVTRLGQQFPDDFPDVEADTRDCLELPGGVVECLAAVKTEADLDGCVRAFCQENPRACPRIEASWTPRPTRAECERAFDHLLGLRGSSGSISEADRATFIDDCHAEAHKRDVDCILATVDLNGIGRCANDAPRAD